MKSQRNVQKSKNISFIRFITKYIICQKKECNKPEIQIKIKGKEINQVCTACGAICSLDNKHKIAKLIIDNPPEMNKFNDKKKDNLIDVKKDKGSDIPDLKNIIKQNIKKIRDLKEKNDDNLVITFLKNELMKQKINSEHKYFIIFHGLFDKNIYDNNFERKAAIIKKVSIFEIRSLKMKRFQKKKSDFTFFVD